MCVFSSVCVCVYVYTSICIPALLAGSDSIFMMSLIIIYAAITLHGTFNHI